MLIKIFTDGSSRGNPGPGGWGTIICNENQVIELGGREDLTTNNRMELMAAISALEYVKSTDLSENLDKIEVFSDSKYVITGITEWIVGWRAKGWKTAGKKSVLNRDLWERLSMATEGLPIEWKYVAGHTGHYGNERCDEIATSFADNLKTNLYSGSRGKYTIKIL